MDIKLDRLGKWEVTVMVLFSLFIVVSTCIVVLKTFHFIPVQDQWLTVDLYQHYLSGTLSFKDFWVQHNEHRLLFPRFLFLLDYIVAHGTGFLLVPLTLLLQGALGVLFSRAVWKTDRLPVGAKIFLSVTAFTLLFWLIQSGNLIWGFQIVWGLNAFFVSLAAYQMAQLDNSEKRARMWMRMGIAALSCVVATYCLANGIFMCGILLLLIWKAKIPRSILLLWFIFCLILGGSYLIGYHSPSSQSSPGESLHHVFKMLHYMLVYLGNPVSRFYRPAGVFAGAVGLGLFFFFLARFFFEKRPSFYLRFGVAQLTYTLITAFVTAMGRGGFGLEQASSSRYFTTLLIFWFFQLTLVYTSLTSAGKNSRWLRIGTLLLCFLFVLPVQLGAIPHRKSEYLKYDEAALAFMVGVQDSSSLSYLYQYYDTDTLIWPRNEFLKRNRLSVYCESWTHVLGENVSDIYQLDSAAVLHGEVNAVRSVDFPSRSGYYVAGKIQSTAGMKIPEVILFADSGKVTGYAKTEKRSAGSFSGYVKGLENKTFDLYGLEKKDSKRIEKILVQ